MKKWWERLNYKIRVNRAFSFWFDRTLYVIFIVTLILGSDYVGRKLYNLINGE